MKKYEFKKSIIEKTFYITVAGIFTKEDGEGYVKEYLKQIAGLNTKEYTLKFDCLNLKVTPSDVIPQLQGCFELYKQGGFKKVIGVIPSTGSNDLNSGVMKMQFNRLARTTGLANFEIVES